MNIGDMITIFLILNNSLILIIMALGIVMGGIEKFSVPVIERQNIPVSRYIAVQ